MEGPYRDRRGYVFVAGDRILRAVSPSAAGVPRELLDSHVLGRLVDGGRLIRTLSVERYAPASCRAGHRQFCDRFLWDGRP